MALSPIRFQGDTLFFDFIIDEDITGWKIRAEFYDKDGNSVQMANTASGGSDAQIEITDLGTESDFTVKVAKNLTDDFDNTCYIEVEVEDTSSPTNLYTVFKGEVNLKTQKITWTTPSS